MMQASAPATARFRFSIPWAVVVTLASMAIVITGAVLILSLILGTSSLPDWDLAPFVAGPALAGMTSAVVASRWRWVSVSAAGIELGQRGAPIFIEWSNVASAEVRRWGMFAVLEVRPVDPHLVRSLTPRPQVPPLRRLAGGPGFRLDVGDLWPTPHALRRHANDS